MPKRILLLLPIIALLIGGCAKDPEVYRAQFRASWISEMSGETPIAPVNRRVYHLGLYPGLTSDSLSNNDPNEPKWVKVKGSYTLEENTIILERLYQIMSIEEEKMILKPDNEETQITLKKLPKDYGINDSIVGTWQISSKDGQDYTSFRITFGAGSYTFYTYNSQEGKWEAKSDEGGKFYKYDNIIIIRSYNNPEFSSSEKAAITGWTITNLERYLGKMSWSGENQSLSFTKVEE